jgi:hypothetical protein
MLAQYFSRLSSRIRTYTPVAAALAMTLGASAIPAAADTLTTYHLSGAKFLDGGSLSGTFTAQFDNAGEFTSVTSVDLMTGVGNFGYPASEYVLNVSGKDDNASAEVWASQPSNPANTFALFTTGPEGSSGFFEISWAGHSLYAGDPFNGDPATYEVAPFQENRDLDPSAPGTLSTTATPEPSSLLLLGAGLLMYGVFGPSRKKKA